MVDHIMMIAHQHKSAPTLLRPEYLLIIMHLNCQNWNW